MRSQRRGDLVVLDGEPPRFVEVAAPDAARDRSGVDVGPVVRVRDLVEELEAPFCEGPAELVPAGDELGDASHVPRLRAQLDVAEPLRDGARLARMAGAREGVPEPLRNQRACSCHAVGRRQPERRLDPLVDHGVVGHPPPHA